MLFPSLTVKVNTRLVNRKPFIIERGRVFVVDDLFITVLPPPPVEHNPANSRHRRHHCTATDKRDQSPVARQWFWRWAGSCGNSSRPALGEEEAN